MSDVGYETIKAIGAAALRTRTPEENARLQGEITAAREADFLRSLGKRAPQYQLHREERDALIEAFTQAFQEDDVSERWKHQQRVATRMHKIGNAEAAWRKVRADWEMRHARVVVR